MLRPPPSLRWVRRAPGCGPNPFASRGEDIASAMYRYRQWRAGGVWDRRSSGGGSKTTPKTAKRVAGRTICRKGDVTGGRGVGLCCETVLVFTLPCSRPIRTSNLSIGCSYWPKAREVLSISQSVWSWPQVNVGVVFGRADKMTGQSVPSIDPTLTHRNDGARGWERGPRLAKKSRVAQFFSRAHDHDPFGLDTFPLSTHSKNPERVW